MITLSPLSLPPSLRPLTYHSYLRPPIPTSLSPSLPLSLPPCLPASLPPCLHPSLSLSPSLFLPPILPPLSLRHTISNPFPLFFPTLLYSSTSLFLHVFARHSFLTHSVILIKSHMDSVMAICAYSHECRSYLCYTKQVYNTCRASLTLS